MRYALLGGAQIAIGAAAIFARLGLQGAQPLAVSASRLAIAAIILLAIAACAPRNAREPQPPFRPLFVIAGFALAIHFATWIWSLEYTSVAISTLLVSTTPIWTALYEVVVRRKRLSLLSWAALAAGIAGLIVVVGFAAAHPPIPGHEVLGGILALLGAFAIGAYLTLIREVSTTHGTRAIVTRTYTWAAIVLILAAACARQAPPALSATQAWFGILAMALVSQLLGHTALNAALRWFSASAVAFTTLLEPVSAGILAFIVFGERLTPAALWGGALVLLAIAAFLREEQKAERSTPQIGSVH